MITATEQPTSIQTLKDLLEDMNTVNPNRHPVKPVTLERWKSSIEKVISNMEKCSDEH